MSAALAVFRLQPRRAVLETNVIMLAVSSVGVSPLAAMQSRRRTDRPQVSRQPTKPTASLGSPFLDFGLWRSRFWIIRAIFIVDIGSGDTVFPCSAVVAACRRQTKCVVAAAADAVALLRRRPLGPAASASARRLSRFRPGFPVSTSLLS